MSRLIKEIELLSFRKLQKIPSYKITNSIECLDIIEREKLSLKVSGNIIGIYTPISLSDSNNIIFTTYAIYQFNIKSLEWDEYPYHKMYKVFPLSKGASNKDINIFMHDGEIVTIPILGQTSLQPGSNILITDVGVIQSFILRIIDLVQFNTIN